MQIASKQPLWNAGGPGVAAVVEMTPATGLFLHFCVGNDRGLPFTVRWGDGSGKSEHVQTTDMRLEHTFPDYGRYKVVFGNISGVGFRWMDASTAYPYDAALVSVVDTAGTLTTARSGAFRGCANLERFVAPCACEIGQRPFAYCTKLREVRLGNCGGHFDGSFQGCTSLERFATVNTGCCWSYVWQGCTSLRELKLGNVSQFATQDFKDTPNLKDIWIADKTVDQIRQVAASGNIVAGYGARFPWGACGDCRFHGTDGIVLGNGTRIA